MKNRLTTHGSILGYFGTACVAVAVGITVMIAIGWRKPANASHANRVAAAHSLPHWMMAAGLLGSPAITPDPSIPPGGAYSGVAEYRKQGNFPFTVPAGVTTVLVQFYGAGGGGGGWTDATQGGGGGGSGAYLMSVVSVTPGETYTISVGSGGAGGSAGNAGLAGGSTSFADPNNTVLISAGGGGGGLSTGGGGLGGQSFVGSPQIAHPGGKGGQAETGGSGGRGSSGYVLTTFVQTPATTVSVGGVGSNGPYNGAPGQAGYALIAW